jgi:2-iminobutanoate/2-iminopropanoate deaminase
MKAVGSGFSMLMATALLAAGCTNMGGGRAWVPQGPGEIPAPKEEARAPAPKPKPAAIAQSEPARPAAAPAAVSSAPAGVYTQSTRYGDLLFVAGQIGMDPRTNQMAGDKVEDQTRQTMENVRAILEANRLTMANVVSVTVYVKDLAQFRAMDDIYETFFKGALPARSVVEVSRLPRGALVEVSVVAGR